MSCERIGQPRQNPPRSGGFGAQIAQRALAQQLRDAHILTLGLALNRVEVSGGEANVHTLRELAGLGPTAQCPTPLAPS